MRAGSSVRSDTRMSPGPNRPPADAQSFLAEPLPWALR